MSVVTEPKKETTGLAGFLLSFVRGLGLFAACVTAFWAYDTYLKAWMGGGHGGPTENMKIAPEHLTGIGVFLLVVGVLLAISFAFGEIGGERAERKGYERSFGFLLCFYFGPIGLIVLNRLAPNDAELQRRAEEEKELEPSEPGTKTETEEKPADKPVWDLVYPRLRPNFRSGIVLLAIGFALTWMLQIRPEDLGGRQANVRNVPYERGDWKCVMEQTSDADHRTLFRYFGMQGGTWQCLREQPANDKSQDEMMQQLKADDYFLRTYVNYRDGHIVQVYLVYRRYGRREFNHNPDMCFPAGGYVLKTRDVAELPYGGQMAPVVHMTFDGSKVEHNSGQVGVPETTVCYLFASGKRTEHQFFRQQLWMALERLLPNKNGWALLRFQTDHRRLLSGGKDEPISANEALAAQQDFMQSFGGEIEKSITTDDTTEAPIVDANGVPVPQQ